MEVLFIVVPLAIVMAGVAAVGFIWSVRGGQYDDLDTPRYRALFEDFHVPPNSKNPAKSSGRGTV